MASWTAFDIINILTDAVLVIWPSIVISGLQTGLKRRAFVILCFSCRYSVSNWFPWQRAYSDCSTYRVMGATIGQLILSRRVNSTSDPTYQLWLSVVCGQLVQSLAIITACIPCIQKFLTSTRSGLVRPDDLRRRRQGDENTSKPFGVYNDTLDAGVKSTELPLILRENTSE